MRVQEPTFSTLKQAKHNETNIGYNCNATFGSEEWNWWVNEWNKEENRMMSGMIYFILNWNESFHSFPQGIKFKNLIGMRIVHYRTTKHKNFHFMRTSHFIPIFIHTIQTYHKCIKKMLQYKKEHKEQWATVQFCFFFFHFGIYFSSLIFKVEEEKIQLDGYIITKGDQSTKVIYMLCGALFGYR